MEADASVGWPYGPLLIIRPLVRVQSEEPNIKALAFYDARAFYCHPIFTSLSL